MDTEGLPPPHRLIAELVRSIGAIPAETGPGEAGLDQRDIDISTSLPSAANALARIPVADRPLLATLHVLYPAVLLPALDLLDRQRVVRYGRPDDVLAVYQVLGDTVHVVHLRAWHCTCAYFALRAVGEVPKEKEHDDDEDDRHFSSPPCRHLLACLLAEKWPALRDHVAMEGCEPETLAGVVAGVE